MRQIHTKFVYLLQWTSKIEYSVDSDVQKRVEFMWRKVGRLIAPIFRQNRNSNLEKIKKHFNCRVGIKSVMKWRMEGKRKPGR